ncbi:MAG: folate-binding protein YgfZ [Ahniella sp.]|nr:folate-binding protein YgfZ [Ahniella sp.]
MTADTTENKRIGLFDLTGPDAASFAQSQFSSDVKSLQPGAGQWSAWLNPQGRVIAFFPLFRLEQDRFVAAIAFGRATEIRDRLQRFLFRSKVKLNLPTDLTLQAGANPPPDAAAQLPGPTADHTYWLAPSTQDSPLPSLTELQSGLPFLASGASERFVAHALGLKRLNAISVNKGCYPGQEIVARTHFLGRNKRALCSLSGVSGGEVGESVFGADRSQSVGELVWVQGDAALAVLHSPEDGMELHNLREQQPVITRIFADS